jgi:hypothetical protein
MSRRPLVPRMRNVLLRCILRRHVRRLFLGRRLCCVSYRCERSRHPRFWCDCKCSGSHGCGGSHGDRRAPHCRRRRPVRRRRVGSIALAHCGLDERMKRSRKGDIDAEATSEHGQDRPSTPRGSQIHGECPQETPTRTSTLIGRNDRPNGSRPALKNSHPGCSREAGCFPQNGAVFSAEPRGTGTIRRARIC